MKLFCVFYLHLHMVLEKYSGDFFLVLISNHDSNNICILLLPHQCRNCQRVRLQCGKSWVRASVGSNQSYKIDICCFSAKHAAIRRKSKDWLAWNQNNVSEWSDMSTRVFQRASTIKIQLSVLVQYKADLIIISRKLSCSHHDIAEGKMLNWR